jgi:hypothetical protein
MRCRTVTPLPCESSVTLITFCKPVCASAVPIRRTFVSPSNSNSTGALSGT